MYNEQHNVGLVGNLEATGQLLSGVIGERGPRGFHFTPDVSDDGDLSWTNDGGLPNPETKNIKGPQGDVGPQGPQGEKGDTGEAAGFGTPVIAATSLPEGSEPTAEISASGPDTAKIFEFEFGIPKGDKGDQGTAAGFGTPSATATTLEAGSSATASVSASGPDTAKVFDFAFGVPKGDKGDTGNSGVYIGPTPPTDPEARVWIDTSDGSTIMQAEGEYF